MKKYLSLVLLVLTLCLTGCMSYKKVPYIQNSRDVDLSSAANLYDAKIMPKDYLTITVNLPKDPEATRMFNMSISGAATTNAVTGTTSISSSSTALQSYLVENDGTIDFPIIGRIPVAGKTRLELQDYIIEKIYPTYVIEKPIVLVTISSFKISVLGEVAAPGQYTVSNGKVNIFEAVALAKDLTVWGQRDNVKIIREFSTGEKKIVELNLNDANIINSPYYQLQQNDIVYVTPNKAKARNSGIGQETTLWMSSLGILMTLTNIVINVLRK
ncbi:MAG: polysaccharide biosynthesis/export family protein [Bacteroidaceae bacterium]|nr:polysaccharide biosynthesis/export family protein [Bacteroidaceae bacterium]